MSFRHRGAAAFLAGAMAATAGVALATIPNEDGNVLACYRVDVSGDVAGPLHPVDPDAKEQCIAGDPSVTRTVTLATPASVPTGPTGPTGPAGPAGPAGAAGAAGGALDRQVFKRTREIDKSDPESWLLLDRVREEAGARLPVPAGSYEVWARVRALNLSFACSFSDGNDCRLADAETMHVTIECFAEAGGREVDRLEHELEYSAETLIPLHGPAVLTSPGDVTVTCRLIGLGSPRPRKITTILNWVDIQAVRIGEPGSLTVETPAVSPFGIQSVTRSQAKAVRRALQGQDGIEDKLADLIKRVDALRKRKRRR